MEKKLIYVCDIDNTICETKHGNYFGSKPIKERIEKMNCLFDAGHKVIYHTARGSETGVHWRELTERQLQEWGAKYTKLVMNKPFGTHYIDDCNVSLEEFFK